MPLTYDFHEVLISEITVPKDRQRKSFPKIKELAESIDRNGLLHPIVITKDKALVAGERRFRAFKLLGRETIPVHYLDEISPQEARVIELEENTKRVDLTWQENCLATYDYHELRVLDEPKWTKVASAEALGMSVTWTRRLITVATALKKGSKYVADAQNVDAAYRVVRREQDRVVKSGISQIDFKKKFKISPGKEEEDEEPEETLPEVSIEQGDFIEWAPQYEGRRFNFIHCDFPYGVLYHTTNYSGSSTWGKYDDTLETYELLLDTLCANVERLLFPSAHLMFWFSMNYYSMTVEKLTAAGFAVNPFPLVWTKDRGVIPDPQRGPRRTYETALLASLGDRKVIKSPANTIYHKVEKEGHISTKPKPVLEHFFQMFVEDITEILDPTCGSGTALAVAKKLRAKRVVGRDVEPEYVTTSFLTVDTTRRGSGEES